MLHLGCQDLPICFLNVQPRTAVNSCDSSSSAEFEIRREQERQIDLLVGTTDRLIINQRTEEARAVFQSAKMGALLCV
jgi:hypothetical protein